MIAETASLPAFVLSDRMSTHHLEDMAQLKLRYKVGSLLATPRNESPPSQGQVARRGVRGTVRA